MEPSRRQCWSVAAALEAMRSAAKCASGTLELDHRGYRPCACLSRSVKHVLNARATKCFFSSVTSHSTRPTVRPFLTTRPTAFSLAFHTGFRKLIFISMVRSEEHTSELQSRGHLVCRLLLEKKKKKKNKLKSERIYNI